jgi:hypothetical protein
LYCKNKSIKVTYEDYDKQKEINKYYMDLYNFLIRIRSRLKMKNKI